MIDPDAERIAEDAVRLERLLPGPVERVWAWLTDPGLRRRWLAGGPMALHPGGAVELRFRHAGLSPDDGPVPERYREMHAHGHVLPGRVTVCEPPYRLAFTWGGADGDDASEVSFELTPRGDRVRLLLVHRRLRRDDMTGVAAGWHAHLAILGAGLRGDRPPAFWTLHAALETRYRDLGAR